MNGTNERDRRDITTVQVTKETRALLKTAARKRGAKLGIRRLTLMDYLNLVAKEE